MKTFEPLLVADAGVQRHHQHDHVSRVATQVVVKKREIREFQKVAHMPAAALAAIA